MSNPEPAWPRRNGGVVDYSAILACGTVRCRGRDIHHSWMAVRVKAENTPGVWSLDVVSGGEHLSDPLSQERACRVASITAHATGYLFLPETLSYIPGSSHFYRNPAAMNSKERT